MIDQIYYLLLKKTKLHMGTILTMEQRTKVFHTYYENDRYTEIYIVKFVFF